MITVAAVLLIAAVILFIIAAWLSKPTWPNVFIAAGLACWSAAQLWPHIVK